jgi:sugar lactone lactonase YvrE
MAVGGLSTLAEGFAFTEGPRWHEDRLWFSDMHDRRVLALGLDGTLEEIVEVAGKPSGLGWLPDGRLLVVSMEDRRLLRVDPGAGGAPTPTVVADLSSVATGHCNDMVVDAAGRAYVGNFGFDFFGGSTELRPADLARVDPDGTVTVAAEELRFPNGSVITPDGRTLIVGESYGQCLTAFDIGPDGSLSGRRPWATLERAAPDGICLDAEGAIWVASPVGHKLLRVAEGGQVLQRIDIEGDRQVFACMLGGPDRRTLFACTALTSDPEAAAKLRSGRIDMIRVAVPGAGLP